MNGRDRTVAAGSARPHGGDEVRRGLAGAAALHRLLCFCGLAAVACLATLGGGAPARLAFLRPALERGELWRVLTTHITHAGAGHLAWNLAGLAAVALAVGSSLSALEWLAVSLASALIASLGVVWLAPEITAMVGLSAVLHGQLAAGAWTVARRGQRLAWGLFPLLAAKLVLERFATLPWTSLSLGERIATEAHLFGSLGGLGAAWLLDLGRPSSSAAMPPTGPKPPSTRNTGYGLRTGAKNEIARSARGSKRWT